VPIRGKMTRGTRERSNAGTEGTERESIKKTNGKTRCKCLTGEVWWTRWTRHVTAIAVVCAPQAEGAAEEEAIRRKGL
jgi:hypothetical protein